MNFAQFQDDGIFLVQLSDIYHNTGTCLWISVRVSAKKYSHSDTSYCPLYTGRSHAFFMRWFSEMLTQSAEFMGTRWHTYMIGMLNRRKKSFV